MRSLVESYFSHWSDSLWKDYWQRHSKGIFMIPPSVREQPLCFSPHIELDLPSNWVWQQGNNRINTRSCAMAWSRPKWNRTKKLAPPLFLWHFHDTTDCPTVCELVALQGRWQGLFAWCRLYFYPRNLMRSISWIKNIAVSIKGGRQNEKQHQKHHAKLAVRWVGFGGTLEHRKFVLLLTAPIEVKW